MRESGSPSALAIIHSSTRAGRYTAPSLHSVGMRNFSADIAYCGSAVEPADNPYTPRLTYDWGKAEPHDVGTFLRETLPPPVWDYFLNPDNPDGLATTHMREQLWVSGLIQWHYKKAALEHIVQLSLDERYSWVLFARSDYLFTSPLPALDKPGPPRTLVMDGEDYDGVNDRLLVFPIGDLADVIRVFDLEELVDDHAMTELAQFMESNRPKNPERLLKFQMRRVGLWERAHALPQLGFCVRPEDETSRWSMGLYSPARKVFIKYPTELALSKITSTPLVSKDPVSGAVRSRPLSSTRPGYFRWVKMAGHHRSTLLAPLLLVLGEGRLSLLIWRRAAAKTARKALRRWRTKK